MSPPAHADSTLNARTALAHQIRAAKETVAAAVTDEFFHRHPDWWTRYGERGRKRGIEDAGYHLDFLAAAIESGSTEAFRDYARWSRRLLARFGIAPAFLAENFQQINGALSQTLAASDAETTALFMEAALAACLESASRVDAAHSSPLDDACTVFVHAILAGQRKEALVIAREALRQGCPVAEVYVHIFQESLYEIGRRWESGQVSIAEEHMATATVQYVIAQFYPDLALPAQRRGSAVITGVQGEFHQVGANIVADVLEADGWSVRFLGTNMPQRDILAAVTETPTDLFGISATMLFNLPHVRTLVAEVRESLGARAPRIVVGGGAFRLCPEFCAELGVQGPPADIVAAVALCAGTNTD